MASPAGDDDYDDRDLFAGVRFFLVGFDNVSESQYRSEMVRRGGADAGRLGGGCTHVVACGRVYDDPVCAAARAQGNRVVSELWVDDSLDRGFLADADRVIYWPTKDLNGIPGSDSLQICLTGYQRNDREDIMKMVSLMGAHFSKPLLGHVVTHLVCYKFEGEKYELAKRLGIKLANHQWLEDCLKSWEILPVDDYNKSSWELEIMEAQAKDSEDEVDARTPFNSRSGVKHTPNPKNSIGTSHNSVVDVPTRPAPIIPSDNQNMAVDRHLNTPDHIRKEENVVNKTHHITAQGTPIISRLASSANTDSGAPVQTPSVISGNREEVAVRDLDNPNQAQPAEYKYVGTDIATGALGTPSSSRMKVSANDHSHSPDEILTVPKNMATPIAMNAGANSASMEVDGSVVNNVNAEVSESGIEKTIPYQYAAVISKNGSSSASTTKKQTTSPQKVPLSRVASALAKKQHSVPTKVNDAHVGSNLESTKVTSEETIEIHSSDETLMLQKNITTPSARNAGAKRPRSANAEVDGSVVGNGKAVVSEPETDKMIPHQHAGATSEKGTSSASATERKAMSPKKVPVGGVRKGVLAKRQQSVHTKANDAHVGSDLELSKLTSHENIEIHSSSEALMVPQNIATPNSRNAGAKRLRGASMGVDVSVVDNGKAVVSESETGKMIPHQHAGATSEKNTSSASATERKTTPPKKVPVGGARSVLAKRRQSVQTRLNDAHLGSDLESSKVISHENIETEPKRFCSSANDDEHGRKSPNKLLSTRVKNTVVKKSRNSDTSTTVEPQVDKAETVPAESLFEPQVDKAETVPAESLFDDLFPSENVKDDPKKLSSSASVDGCGTVSPEKILRTRVRKVVAKRKIKNMEDKSGSKHGKIGSSIASAAKALSSERIDSACNIEKATADQDSLKGNNDGVRDVSVLSFKDTAAVDKSEGMHNSKLRGSRRNKAPASEHDNDNQQDHGDLSSRTSCGNGGLNSKFALKSKKNKTDMLDKHGGIDKSEGMHTSKLRCSKRNQAPASDHDNDNRQDHGSKDTVTVDKSEGTRNSKLRSSARNKTPVSEHDNENQQDHGGKDTVTVDKSEGMHNSKLRSRGRNKAPASDHDTENRQDHGSKDTVTIDKSEGTHNSKLRSRATNKTPSDHDNENRQNHDLNSKFAFESNRGNGDLNSKFALEAMKNNTDVVDKHGGIEGNGAGTLITLDPACFILSGHRHQRKDYRSILRRLKGRVCRDSHHWSYQATHFIAPTPLRRTEKFFAAAAAGRWILKSDYLTSCNEAGKLLAEEPFEWSGTGLNEGETISFEAPRKWRVLRQQMGHGAFYGMQIVIYGQLIAPSLDTVKRAVRAGDGNILATSPPYTRFLNSGVDFAVISAGMPSADAWVQEFIRHDIPCVSADYLVEYVCKPGYPLDTHVLFKTSRLATKSLDKLLKSQQEVAMDNLEASEDDGDDDLSCAACGSTDRAEVMLICGSEDGTVGCGVGMHIDCCDPPLDHVPDDDWLCPKCEAPKAKKKPPRGAASKSRGSSKQRR
uniref:BRCT domain-containing protein n=2 Tax=Hordeum vulgare subsp. vulgare TaxID=112509 RepID=A0A8I6XYV1_HORVV